MATLEQLVVKNFSLNGRNYKRVDTLGAFLSLEEAIQSVADGSIKPSTDSVNVRSIVYVLANTGFHFYEWSNSLGSFTEIGRGDASGVLANAYIRLQGTDELIEFEQMQPGNPAYCMLNLDFDFSITIKIPIIDTPENGQRIKLIENGQNAIQINVGSGNYGLYFTDGTISAGVNVFSEVVANDELTFVYTASDKKMCYYINGTNKKTLSLSDRTNNANGKIKIGAPTGAERLKGGVDNLVVYNVALSSNDTDEIKNAVPIEQRTAHGDAVAYCKLGEAVYPSIVDQKGNLNDGELKNGSPDDFVPIS